MKKALKLLACILFAVFITAALISPPLTEVRAEDNSVSWKQSLKNFLVNGFPSLFDGATINRNAEVLNNWLNSWGKDANGNTDYSVNTYVPKPGDIPIDALGEWNGLNPYYPLLLPIKCTFYDLDGDGIPEVFISYPTVYAEGSSEFVYKLYNGNYEKIDAGEYLNGAYMEYDELYTNSQNKTVIIRYGPDGAEKISFLNISNQKAAYGDHIDSNGNSYNDLRSLLYNTTTYKYDEAKFNEILSELNPLVEFDVSDVINSIAGTQTVPTSPTTGNTGAGVFAVPAVISAAVVVTVLNKKKRYIKI